MATSTSSMPQEGPDYLQPRPRKPGNPQIIRAQSQERLATNGQLTREDSGLSSGRSTPVPEDAPPSIHATSFARQTIRAQRKRLFPNIEYAARLSHFDPKSDYHDFRGFFVLFWIGLAIMVITAMLRNFKETGYPLVFKQWPTLIENIWEMGIIDAAMSASIMLSLPLHRLYASGDKSLSWSQSGMAIQSAYQAVWLAFWVIWPFARNWTWTAQVFFTLHLLVMFMKMHSYAFYNGHLSETKRRLNELDHPEGVSKEDVVKYPRTHSPLRGNTPQPEGTNDSPFEEDSPDEKLQHLRESLAAELTSPLSGNVSYPQNLTAWNFVDYLLCPTLCYELEYPRLPKTDYLELFYKTLAVFGCIFLITLTTEEFVLPVLEESAAMLHTHMTFGESALTLAETISRLLFPFMVTFLLVFLVIFEYLLGAFAEITRFADRRFYNDWWNSCDWLEFSREWNIPVHHFLRRHVYFASRGVGGSKGLATIVTFLVSAVAHELVMGCITKKLRGYGFIAMMLQIPIVMVQKSRWIRGRTLLNNVLFWCSMILGLSMMCSLYVLV